MCIIEPGIIFLEREALTDNIEKDTYIKMRTLDFTLKILTICGCGRPDSWTMPCKRLVYYVYTIFILLLIHTFMLSQLMDLIMTVDNSDDFTDNFYILLAMIVSCCKMFALLVNRSNIEMLIDTLTRKPLQPIESDEMEIRQKYERLIQSNTLHYVILVETTCLCVTVTSLLTEFRKGNLTFRGWLPFDYSSPLLFLFVYAHQLISFTVGSVHHVACDSLICGLLMHICCQLEILECRIRKGTRNPKILRECAIQHKHIFKFAYMVNDKFRLTIFIQFVVSTLVVCFNLYQFTKSTALRAKYIQLILYMSCMLSQIFFYCWCGNEVKLRSYYIQSRQLVDNVFDMEWFELNEDHKKALLLIMKRSTVPIEFTSASVISMNLDSFLLKTSYSAYNILQRTQDS
ncbi:odorant receptor 94a-like isoform X2 [Anoplolepis gracilipes]|uniref:odorant receptor 94a-like isoform X2 n=1 Tax=Anoplolepis gracilipes TaxID=354296 RepID=UPI003BA13F53